MYTARRGAMPVAHWQRTEFAEPAWQSEPVAPAWQPRPAPFTAMPGAHPLADPTASIALHRHAEQVEAAFAAIEPVLQRLAPLHYDQDYPLQARTALRGIGLDMPAELFGAHIMAPLDMRFLHARCIIGTFCRLLSHGVDRSAAEHFDGESARTVISRWGFHAVDISACSDGRLAGVLDFILRVPPSVVAFSDAHAGARFNITEAVRHWETIELRRFRDAIPNPAGEPTRFLKLGVYHFSSADPEHQGCAAHGSNTARAAAALLERLQDFEQGLRNTHGAGARAAILLVGVDTDTDAIRVHVPDAAGGMSIDRFADSLTLHQQTAHLSRDAAKDAIRAAVAACAGASASDPATEGMRWFCGYLLKNNIAQVDFVRANRGIRAAGHTEKLIVVGDAVDEIQMRNVAFQAQMETVEEGAADLDIGIAIHRKVHDRQGLAVPVLVHFRYDPRLPRSVERASYKARRMMAAIIERHGALASRKKLFVQAVLREEGGTGMVMLDPAPEALAVLEDTP